MILATAFTLAPTGGAVWGGVIGLVRASRSGGGSVGSTAAWAWFGRQAAGRWVSPECSTRPSLETRRPPSWRPACSGARPGKADLYGPQRSGTR
jgi:hypothetical protein